MPSSSLCFRRGFICGGLFLASLQAAHAQFGGGPNGGDPFPPPPGHMTDEMGTTPSIPPLAHPVAAQEAPPAPKDGNAPAADPSAKAPNADPPPVKNEDKPEWTASLNYWNETNGRDTFLNLYFLTVARDNLDIIAEHLVVPGQTFERLRVHYGNFYILNNDDAKILFRPGAIVDTIGGAYIGGRLSFDFPKLNLSISHNGYAGLKIDRHESFVEWKPLENAGIMYYQFADKSQVPKSLLGPRIYLGPIYAYFGMPLNSHKETLFWLGGSFKF